MWPLFLVVVFVSLGLAPRRAAGVTTPVALLAIVAMVGLQAVRGHLL